MKRIGRTLPVILSAALLVVVGAMFGPRTAHAIVSALVTVVNNVGVVNPTPSGTIQPVITTETDSLSRVPYQDGCTAVQGIVVDPIIFCFTSAVPAGKRLVIEQVTALCQAPTGKVTAGIVNATIGSSSISHYLVLTPQDTVLGFTGRVYATSELVRLYVDPGAEVEFAFSSGDSAATCASTLSGYLEPTNVQ